MLDQWLCPNVKRGMTIGDHKKGDEGEVQKIPAFFRSFSLSQKSLDERRRTIGGSEINTLAAGDPKEINDLYERKVAGTDLDLSTVWPVLMGYVTEEVNTEWCQYKQGIEIIDRQRVINGKKHDFMRCTLDGAVHNYKDSAAVFDAKFTMGRPMKGEEWSDVIPRLVRKYTPQLHWNGFLLSEALGRPVEYGLLSILKGGNEPTFHEVKLDPEYTKHLIGLATYFMGCIEMGVYPDEVERQEIILPPEDRLPVDMTQSNNDARWEQLANTFIQTAGAAETYKKAEAGIKKLVPPHASEAFGHGIRVKVAKNNAKKIEVINE